MVHHGPHGSSLAGFSEGLLICLFQVFFLFVGCLVGWLVGGLFCFVLFLKMAVV